MPSCGVEDTDGGNGEFYVRGQAIVIHDPAERARVFRVARESGFNPKDRYIIFELDIRQAASLVYQASKVIRNHWSAD